MKFRAFFFSFIILFVYFKIKNIYITNFFIVFRFEKKKMFDFYSKQMDENWLMKKKSFVEKNNNKNTSGKKNHRTKNFRRDIRINPQKNVYS